MDSGSTKDWISRRRRKKKREAYHGSAEKGVLLLGQEQQLATILSKSTRAFGEKISRKGKWLGCSHPCEGGQVGERAQVRTHHEEKIKICLQENPSKKKRGDRTQERRGKKTESAEYA